MAHEQGINVSPLSIQYQHGVVQRGLVMGFAACDEKTTRQGLRKLRQILGDLAS